MSRLLSRTAILTASRLSNFAIHLFSPLLLVRMLDVTSYGQYQEFVTYSALLAGLCSFAIDNSLTYFLPRFPERELAFLSQSAAITLAISTLVLGTMMLIRPVFLKMFTYDFVGPLCAYTFVSVNLNWLEYYWIAKRQANRVLYYSAARLTFRLGVLLLVAYATRDIPTILWSLVGVETCRVLLTFAYFSRKGAFVRDMRWSEIREQIQFSGPIGAAGFVQNAGRSIGKIFTSSTLGAASLAFYATGSYLLPIVRMTRSGIEDAVYPELVRAHSQPGGALRLWQRVNVVNCVLFFPAFVVLVFYARQIITIMFTAKYLAAVPIFNVYALFLLRRCFNMDVLLRTQGRTGFVLWGAIGALATNVLLIVLLARGMGLIGPAIAFIGAEVGLELYYVYKARRAFNLAVADIADWASIGRIAISCVLALPILFGFGFLPVHPLVRMVVGSATYVSVVFLIAYRLGVSDIGRVVGYAWSLLRRKKSDNTQIDGKSAASPSATVVGDDQVR